MRLFLAALFVPLASGLASACPFCQRDGAGFFSEVAQSDFVVLGTVRNAKRDLASGELGRGTTDLVITTVVKPHPYLAGKKQITLPRYIPADPRTANGQFLVFCSLYTRPADAAAAAVVSTFGIGSAANITTLDAVRGDPVSPDSKIAEYLAGAIAVRAQDPAARLKYFFNYLDAADLLIGTDALNEFAGTEYPDVRKAAAGLSADKLRRW